MKIKTGIIMNVSVIMYKIQCPVLLGKHKSMYRTKGYAITHQIKSLESNAFC